MRVDDVINAYRQLREKKEEIVARHKEELGPVNDQMLKCLAWIQQQLQAQGLTNFKGESGIAFLQTDTSVTVKDREAFFTWVKENDLFQMLDARASKSVVIDYIEQFKAIPPGLGVNSEQTCHIRKS
jgi:hypothetical protein